jgi:hypothetical protein
MRSAALLAALLALPVAAQDPAADPGPAAAASTPAPAGPTTIPARPPGDPEARPTPPAAVLEEVTGTVSAVDRAGQKIDLTTAKGPVTLKLDRNTLVYSQGSLGTVLDLAVGQPVRAGRNATSTAYWVQLRPAAAKAGPAGQAATPGQGPGPAPGAPPAPPPSP